MSTMKKLVLAVFLMLGLGMAMAPASFAGGGPPGALPKEGNGG